MMLLRVLLQACLAAGALATMITGLSGHNNSIASNTSTSDVMPMGWKEGNIAMLNGPPDWNLHNCEDISKHRIIPQIDCSYSWENCFFQDYRQNLEYSIKIDPVGDSSDQWCEILVAQIQKRTKHLDNFWFSCNKKYKSSDIGNGLWLAYKIARPWPEGEDFTTEIEWAIKFSMCGDIPMMTNWVNQGCYRDSICKTRYWSKEYPWQKETNLQARNVEMIDMVHESSTGTITAAADAGRSTIYFDPRGEPDLANAIISAPSPTHENTPAAATPPPGIDPDFTCAFVDPSKGLSTKVDCSYYYDREHDRMKYEVDIQPTGQDSTRWCEQLIAALRHECPHGHADDRYVTRKCETDVFGSDLGKGMSINFDAFSWFQKDDNAECTEKAIKSTTCGIPAIFEKGGCYKSK